MNECSYQGCKEYGLIKIGHSCYCYLHWKLVKAYYVKADKNVRKT
jgi:hypothetical protein